MAGHFGEYMRQAHQAWREGRIQEAADCANYALGLPTPESLKDQARRFLAALSGLVLPHPSDFSQIHKKEGTR